MFEARKYPFTLTNLDMSISLYQIILTLNSW